MPVRPDPRWFITRHAQSRMSEMEVMRQEVLDTISDPEHHDPAGNQDLFKDGRVVYTRGRLAVVAHPLRREVITVLWNGQDAREDGPRTC